MGFYGNYYKIKPGDGLEVEEQGQSSIVKFTKEVKDALGIRVNEDGTTIVDLSKELRDIKAELGAINPDSEFAGYTGSKIDNIETILDINENQSQTINTISDRLNLVELELSGTSTEDGIENSRIDLLENEIDDIKDGATIVKNSKQLGGEDSSSYALIGEQTTDTSTLFTIHGTRKYIDESITNLNLGTMSKEDKKNYVLETEAPGYNDILTKTDAKIKYATIENKNDLNSRLSKIEAEISGTSTEDGIENSRIDQLEDNIKTIQNAGYQTANDVTAAITSKADKTTTLEGYGITDAYTKTEIEGAFVSKEKFNTLEQEVLGKDNNSYEQSRIDTLTTTVQNNNTSINGLNQKIINLIDTVNGIKNGVFQGILSDQDQYNALLDENNKYNYQDYWLIYDISQNADGTDGSITIYNDVVVYNGDVIEYVGLDNNSNKIFMKQNTTLNLIKGTGLYSTQALAATANVSGGEGSVTFGSNNENYGKNTLIIGNSNTTGSSSAVKNSLVFGNNNQVVSQATLIGGSYANTNVSNDQPAILFALGNGVNKNARNNAFSVDKAGNAKVDGNLNVKNNIEVSGNLIISKTNDEGLTSEYNILGNITELQTNIADLRTDITALDTNKADKKTTLAGYGITNAYTKEEVNSNILNIQNLIKLDNETLPNNTKSVYDCLNSLDSSVGTLTTTINEVNGEITTINGLIKSDNETLPESDTIKTVYGCINDIYGLIKKNEDSSLPYPSKSVYGNINEINNKVENINIPQWEIHNNIKLTAGWSAMGDYYAYNSMFVLEQQTDIDKYIVLFDIDNAATKTQRENLIQCSVTAKLVVNDNNQVALQLIALRNPNQDNVNILSNCPITYSYIIGEVWEDASVQ